MTEITLWPKALRVTITFTMTITITITIFCDYLTI